KHALEPRPAGRLSLLRNHPQGPKETRVRARGDDRPVGLARFHLAAAENRLDGQGDEDAGDAAEELEHPGCRKVCFRVEAQAALAEYCCAVVEERVQYAVERRRQQEVLRTCVSSRKGL